MHYIAFIVQSSFRYCADYRPVFLLTFPTLNSSMRSPNVSFLVRVASVIANNAQFVALVAGI